MLKTVIQGAFVIFVIVMLNTYFVHIPAFDCSDVFVALLICILNYSLEKLINFYMYGTYFVYCKITSKACFHALSARALRL